MSSLGQRAAPAPNQGSPHPGTRGRLYNGGLIVKFTGYKRSGAGALAAKP